MSTRLASISKTLVGLIFLAGIGLYVFRQSILVTLIDSQLKRLDIPVSTLIVEDVSLNSLVIRDLTLGDSDELRTDKIKATWRLQDLLRAELHTIEITGLKLLFDLSGDHPPLGSLQKLFAAEESSSNSKIPQITIQDAELNLLTQYGNMLVNIDGKTEQRPSDETLIKMIFKTTAAAGHANGSLDATLDKEGNLQGALTVSEGVLTLPYLNIADINASSTFGLVDNQIQEMTAELTFSDINLPESGQTQSDFEQAHFTVHMDQSNARVKGEIVTTDKVPALSFDVTSRDYQQQANIDINLNADIAAELPFWNIAELPQPSTGSASLSLHATGQIPASCVDKFIWQGCLQQSVLSSTGKVTLDGLGYTQKISDLTGKIVFDAALEHGYCNIVLKKDNELVASGLDNNWLKGLGIPVAQTSFLNQETKLRLSLNGNNRAGIDLGNFSATDGIKLELDTGIILAADTAQTSMNGHAVATLNQQHRLTDFEISDLEVITSGLNYSTSSLDQLIFNGNIHGTPDSYTGEIDLNAKAGRIHLDPLDARDVKAKLPLQLSFKDRLWRLTLRKPGNISIGKPGSIETVRIPDALSFRLTEANVDIFADKNGAIFKHHITVLPDDFNLLINRKDAPEIETNIKPGRIVLSGRLEQQSSYSGKNTIQATTINFPQYQIQLDNIASTIYFATDNESMDADFNIGEIRQLTKTAYFSPLSLTGNMKLRGKQLSVNANGKIPGNTLLNLKARHSLASEKGSLKLALNPLIFKPDSLHPSSIFPGLATLREVNGEISASSKLNWSKKDIRSDAELNVINLSFVHNNTILNGLTASITMTDLLSPKSEAKQKLTIQQFNPGVPIKDVEVIYQVQTTESPKIAFEQAQLSVLGGSLSTGPVIIDPLATHNDVFILVEGVDLSKLFELIEVDGLTGEGHLHGTIPISFDNGLASIQNSVLTAEKPGILRVKSETVSKLLSGKAEEVDLLLQALTEFHYSELMLTLNNSASNDLVATLSLLGNNPEVQQGRLFRLNINLESNIGKILNAITQAYGLSNKAIQRAFRLH